MLTLRRLRIQAGWTRTELGWRARLHPARVGQIELGRVRPPVGSVELRRLADALHFAGDPFRLLEPVEGASGDAGADNG